MPPPPSLSWNHLWKVRKLDWQVASGGEKNICEESSNEKNNTKCSFYFKDNENIVVTIKYVLRRFFVCFFLRIFSFLAFTISSGCCCTRTTPTPRFLSPSYHTSIFFPRTLVWARRAQCRSAATSVVCFRNEEGRTTQKSTFIIVDESSENNIKVMNVIF